MKKNKKYFNRLKAETDIEELDAEGFEVTKFTDVHWRILKVDEESFVVDVWPTTKKMMLVRNHKVIKYDNLYTAIKELYSEEVF